MAENINPLEAALSNGFTSHTSKDEHKVQPIALNTAVCKNFAFDLIDRMVDENWETLQLGQFVRIVSMSLFDLKRKKTMKLICSSCASLVDLNFLQGLDIDFKPSQLMHILKAGNLNPQRLLSRINEMIEGGYFQGTDDTSIDELCNFIQMDHASVEEMEMRLFSLCQSFSKIEHGLRLLKQLSIHWQIPQQREFLQKFVSLEVIPDLEGDLTRLVQAYFPHVYEQLEFPSLLDQEDADKNGNLIGFIESEVEVEEFDELEEEEEGINDFIEEEAEEESDAESNPSDIGGYLQEMIQADAHEGKHQRKRSFNTDYSDEDVSSDDDIYSKKPRKSKCLINLDSDSEDE